MKVTARRYTLFEQLEMVLEKNNALIITMGAGDIYKVAEQITD